ncbi:TIGR03619 family F420-dependent LLM class oxidoreductase [Jatrophihabitans sp.]|uniref:TIGR03619 family F420-dependent LLM class oxidoreductase n=1 Tax=Jatrophihabitans sp. TaxID=1932789 RepID=UPI0030C6A023|nr:hypothetical protein [Jatrophihabitans sp.]
MKLSLFCRPYNLPQADEALFPVAARMADDAGFYSIHFGEHILIAEQTDRYPFGPWTHGLDAGWSDPLIALAAATAVTSRIKLSSGIILAPLHPAAVLAKQIATLDVLSRGRAELAFGVGWQPEEFEAVGVPFDRRYSRLDDTLRACRALWGSQPASFTSDSVRFSDVRAYPLPVQERVPVLLGLKPTPRNAARIAEYGDGWCPVRYSPEQVAAGLEVIRPAMEAAGRDPDSLIVRVQAPLVLLADGRINVHETLAVGPAYERAGATVLAVGPTLGCRDVDDMDTLIKEIADAAEPS